MSKTVRSFLFVVVAMSLLLAACGTPVTETPTAAAPAPVEPTKAPEPTAVPTEVDPMAMYAPAAVTGDIITAGSSTVFPLSERMAELFQQEGYTGNVTVDSIGSGAGLERFCKTGETDVANSSRKIKDSEVEACAALATPRTPVEFRVGTDALTVVVSADNDFVTALTKEQLGKIFTAQFTKWNEVDPSYPAEAILVYGPGADSGTFDYFNEVAVAPLYKNADGKADTKAGKAALLAAPGAQFSEDDNVLVQGVEGSKFAIGYFGFAYFSENSGKLKAVAVEGVEPSEATVNDGTYPISRPLFLYSDAAILKAKPQVAAFIYFYLSNVNNEISDVGYFPAPDKDLQASMDAWKSAMSGEAAAPAADPMAEMYAPAAVTGDIITAGSSTVFPLSERMAELFQQEGYTGNVTVDSIGSGAGLERFCKTGETDVANSSRKIKDSEVEACAALATPRTPVEFRVGTDALTVVVSADNDFVTALTKEQLGKIFTAQFTKWNEVDPSYPAEAILVYGPGADSGTFDYFNEVAVAPLYKNADGKADTKAGKAALLAAPGAQFSEDDNVLVQGVEGSKFAIGYFGFAYFSENSGKLKAVAVEGVEPSQATVDDGTYPISRPLFLYSDAAILKEKPQVAAFIYFYLNNVNNEISDVGYFPAPAADLKASMDAFTTATK